MCSSDLDWQDVVQAWQSYPHLGIRAISDRNGEEKLVPLVHPIVAEEAQTILSKPAKEAGSVLSTVVSNLALFRDPVIARNTGRSSFRIRDLMHNDSPVSLYLIVNPNDQLRLTPLTRLIITQIVFNLVQKMDFRDGRSVEGYRHRLLLLLDEFPSLGRMELFERALGFIGGYGLKAYIIVQDLSQLYKAYTKEESIQRLGLRQRGGGELVRHAEFAHGNFNFHARVVRVAQHFGHAARGLGMQRWLAREGDDGDLPFARAAQAREKAGTERISLYPL